MFAPPNLLASKASSGHILLASEMAQLERMARAQTRSLPALQARAGKMAIDNECYRQRIEKERFVASLPLDADDPTDTGLPAYRAPPSDVYSAYGHSHSSLPWNSDVSVKEVLNEDRLPAPAWSAQRRLLRAGAGAVEDVAPAPARTPARCCCCRDATQLKAGI